MLTGLNFRDWADRWDRQSLSTSYPWISSVSATTLEEITAYPGQHDVDSALCFSSALLTSWRPNHLSAPTEIDIVIAARSLIGTRQLLMGTWLPLNLSAPSWQLNTPLDTPGPLGYPTSYPMLGTLLATWCLPVTRLSPPSMRPSSLRSREAVAQPGGRGDVSRPLLFCCAHFRSELLSLQPFTANTQ